MLRILVWYDYDYKWGHPEPFTNRLMVHLKKYKIQSELTKKSFFNGENVKKSLNFTNFRLSRAWLRLPYLERQLTIEEL